MDLAVFEELESSVRSYCRSFPTVFDKALGSALYDTSQRRYLDFFSGAGTLSYGHNNPRIKRRLLAYLEDDRIIHSLDMATEAKRDFLERFQRVILKPRGLDYLVQFPGPTGTNAVEASLKLARKVTGRRSVIYFRGAFHGMTLGALSISGDPVRRERAGIPLDYTQELPFESDDDGAGVLERLEAQWRGVGEEELPAAVILETVQAEGGVRAASFPWLSDLAALARRHGVLLIVDDIQVGCGRTGTFFSFEPAAIAPDLVCLSKAIGGYGLPLALVLIRPDLDLWQPGEHNGTFRGQNLSFVAAAEALAYWEDDVLATAVRSKAEIVQERLREWAEAKYPELRGSVVGRGLIQGLRFAEAPTAGRVSRAAFERGLVIECAGLSDEVLKILPALTIPEEELREGLEILDRSLEATRHSLAGTPAVTVDGRR